MSEHIWSRHGVGYRPTAFVNPFLCRPASVVNAMAAMPTSTTPGMKSLKGIVAGLLACFNSVPLATAFFNYSVTPPPVRKQRIAMSVSVCPCVWLLAEVSQELVLQTSPEPMAAAWSSTRGVQILCVFGFIDNVIFVHNESYGDMSIPLQ